MYLDDIYLLQHAFSELIGYASLTTVDELEFAHTSFKYDHEISFKLELNDV